MLWINVEALPFSAIISIYMVEVWDVLCMKTEIISVIIIYKFFFFLIYTVYVYSFKE